MSGWISDSVFVGREASREAADVAGCELPEQLHVGPIARLELLGHPGERSFEPERMKLCRRLIPRRPGPNELTANTPPRGVGRQGVTRHPVSLVQQPFDEPGRTSAANSGSVPRASPP